MTTKEASPKRKLNCIGASQEAPALRRVVRREQKESECSIRPEREWRVLRAPAPTGCASVQFAGAAWSCTY
jgi:hypothetical protein